MQDEINNLENTYMSVTNGSVSYIALPETVNNIMHNSSNLSAASAENNFDSKGTPDNWNVRCLLRGFQEDSCGLLHTRAQSKREEANQHPTLVASDVDNEQVLPASAITATTSEVYKYDTGFELLITAKALIEENKILRQYNLPSWNLFQPEKNEKSEMVNVFDTEFTYKVFLKKHISFCYFSNWTISKHGFLKIVTLMIN